MEFGIFHEFWSTGAHSQAQAFADSFSQIAALMRPSRNVWTGSLGEWERGAEVDVVFAGMLFFGFEEAGLPLSSRGGGADRRDVAVGLGSLQGAPK